MNDEKRKLIKAGVTDSGESYTTFIVPFLTNTNFIVDSYLDKPSIEKDAPTIDNLPISSYTYSIWQKGKNLLTIELDV